MNNDKMNYRCASCCGNCCFMDDAQKFSQHCLVDGMIVDLFNVCDLFAFDEKDVSEKQWQTINEIKMGK